MVRATLFVLVAAGTVALSAPAHAQTAGTDTLSNAGVVRAAVLVDSVFVQKTRHEATIGGGDWTSYMMARLGIRPIPSGMGIHVAVDTARIELDGKIGDLPPEARAELSPLFRVFGPETPYTAEIALYPAGDRAVRFRLASVTINRIPIPDMWLQAVMTSVGKQYPALTKTGRDLFVAIPRGGQVTLAANGVQLVAPPDSLLGGAGP